MPGAEAAGPPWLVVLDASVAVRWLVPEPTTDEATALLERPFSWTAPRLILTEIASALRRKVGDGELLNHEALLSLDVFLRLVDAGTVRVAADEDLMHAALALALLLGHKLPDCVYLALAERQGIGLVTADRRLSALAERRGVSTVLLAS